MEVGISRGSSLVHSHRLQRILHDHFTSRPSSRAGGARSRDLALALTSPPTRGRSGGDCVRCLDAEDCVGEIPRPSSRLGMTRRECLRVWRLLALASSKPSLATDTARSFTSRPSSRAGGARSRDLALALTSPPTRGRSGGDCVRCLDAEDCVGEIPRPSSRLGMTRRECLRVWRLLALASSKPSLATDTARSFTLRPSSRAGGARSRDLALALTSPPTRGRSGGDCVRCLDAEDCVGEIPRPSSRLGMTRQFRGLGETGCR